MASSSAPKTDVEAGETEPLLGHKNEILAKIQSEVVGGVPGDAKFYTTVQLALRSSCFAVFLGLVVWEKQHFAEASWILPFADHMPLAICIIIFSVCGTMGTVINGAGAAMTGVLIACANIFILRGFFPSGVEPDMHPFALEKVVAWTDIIIFNLTMLSVDCRPAVRIFSMSQNTNFMLAFLNPNNVAVYSKNFTLNWNGAAVTAFIGISIGAILSVVVMLLPYPWCFAYNRLQSNAEKASADISKMFINVVKYCSGRTATVQIDRLYNQLEAVRKEIDTCEADIGAAYLETWDLSKAGTVRKFMKKHSELLNELFDLLYATIIPLQVEDFGDSHGKIMDEIKDDCSELVTSSAILLMTATNYSRPFTTPEEDKTLADMEQAVKEGVKKLATDFDKVRRVYEKPLSRELMSESAFAFTLSSFARKIVDYSEMLRTNKPEGDTWAQAISETINARTGVQTPTLEGARFIARYMIGLMMCFLFSMYFDNFSPACAITGVFLLNDRPSPDIKGSLDLMLAIVVGSVVGTLMFSWACRSGHGDAVLPILFFCLLFPSTWVAHSRSSFSTIGFFVAALSPFSMVKDCPAPELASSSHAAVGLWAGIRARSIAMFILTACEFIFMERRHSKFTADYFDNAAKAIQSAFASLWTGANPKPALDDAAKNSGHAFAFGCGAKVEPRFGGCEFKIGFLEDCLSALSRLRIDVLMTYRGMGGLDGSTEDVSKLLQGNAGFRMMQEELDRLLDNARIASTGVLLHTNGDHTQLAPFQSMTGIDRLAQMDKALEGLNGALTFPEEAPETMEKDQICQLALMFTMLELAKKHVASIIFSGMKHT